ncbi:hypothetical protein ASPCAL11014 [Aspergillus calidoustus]|uniref:Uncharacterized protein n=1 Tax=Aspergillus calidoustus TaxID=454130 RepID=A0A0U5H224_ASPCI|nr:hypothetical protein ASPCAL11014 [Aspergillus calidoustus]
MPLARSVGNTASNPTARRLRPRRLIAQFPRTCVGEADAHWQLRTGPGGCNATTACSLDFTCQLAG